MQTILTRLFAAAALVFMPATLAQAAQKPLKAPVVTVKPGKASGIHDLYAWDGRCRPVAVGFKVLKAGDGRLYTVPATYRIKGAAGDTCNGRMVSGKKILFQPKAGFKGSTLVRYSVSAPKIKNTYVISRSISVR